MQLPAPVQEKPLNGTLQANQCRTRAAQNRFGAGFASRLRTLSNACWE